MVYLAQYFLQLLLQHDLCGRTSLASEPGDKVLHFDFVLYGRLLDKNSYRCEPLTDLSYPVVLLQGGESRGDRFIESLRGNLYGVLNVSKISDRNRARSKNHVQEGNIFAFCSLGTSNRDPTSRFAVSNLSEARLRGLVLNVTFDRCSMSAQAVDRRLI